MSSVWDDTSVKQHYKSEQWAPSRNQTPSWYDWKIVKSDIKPKYTHRRPNDVWNKILFLATNEQNKLYGVIKLV